MRSARDWRIIPVLLTALSRASRLIRVWPSFCFRPPSSLRSLLSAYKHRAALPSVAPATGSLNFISSLGYGLPRAFVLYHSHYRTPFLSASYIPDRMHNPPNPLGNLCSLDRPHDTQIHRRYQKA